MLRLRNFLLLLFAVCASMHFAHAQLSVPYFTNFQDSGVGWTHYDSTGTDDWEVGYFEYTTNPGGYDDSMCFATNLDTNHSDSSLSYLQSPAFDLSDTSTRYALEFKARTRFTSYSAWFYVEYSTDTGQTWSTLDESTNRKFRWIASGTFPNNWSNGWVKATHSLKFLQGEEHVQFRFAFDVSQVSFVFGDQFGVAIDDFGIQDEVYNIQGDSTLSDTTTWISQNSEEFEITINYLFESQFNHPNSGMNMRFDFFLSPDLNLDTSDHYLGFDTDGMFGGWNDEEFILPLPSGLNAGYYYVIAQIDSTQIADEIDETDNYSYSVLKVDSVYTLPYIEDFENPVDNWMAYPSAASTSGVYPNSNLPAYFKYGFGDRFRTYGAHSGTKEWHYSRDYSNAVSSDQVTVSPFIDLTSESGPIVFSFWFKNDAYSSGNGSLTSTHIHFQSNFGPYMQNQNLSGVHGCRQGTWDYKNIYVPGTYADETHAMFSIAFEDGTNWATWNSFKDGTAFDDVYVGAPKADLSIEYTQQRYSSPEDVVVDSLIMKLVNSGVLNAASFEMQFYHSLDDSLDSNDVLLDIHNIDGLPAESFINHSLTYSKPTTNGTYYILVAIDSDDDVDEMREYNNLAVFRIENTPRFTIPYCNGFEEDTIGWSHAHSLIGDAWTQGVPEEWGGTLNGDNSWMANFYTDSLPRTRSELYSPMFDFTDVEIPVLELMYRSLGPYTNTYSGDNISISYSTNGGRNWIGINDSTVYSHGAFSTRYNYYSRYESVRSLGSNEGRKYPSLYWQSGRQARLLLDYFIAWTGFNFKDHVRVIALPQLSGEHKVQFRITYVAGTEYTQDKGVAEIDDFSIKEHYVDLFPRGLPDSMHVTSQTDQLNFQYYIGNKGNFEYGGTRVRYYLSNDSTLDATDVEIADDTVLYYASWEELRLRPHWYALMNSKLSSFDTMPNASFLLIDIDADDEVLEMDEGNNLGVVHLVRNPVQSVPEINRFRKIDDWHWENQHYNPSRRIRVEAMFGQEGQVGYVGDTFHIRTETTPGWVSSSQSPLYYVESPPYYVPDTNHMIEFDLLCVGRTNSPSDGGQLQYSTDHGETWSVLGTVNDPKGTEWYNASNISTITGPGWAFLNWKHSSYQLSSFSGDTIRFRFKYKSIYDPYNMLWEGLHVDNWSFHSNELSTNLYHKDPKCYNDSNGRITPFTTGGTPPYSFAWSNGATTDTLLNLPAGMYVLTITDSSGTIITDSVELKNPVNDSVQASLLSTTAPGCGSGSSGSLGGSITASASGGNGNYTYSWCCGTVTSGTMTGLIGGNYSVTVSDGCTADTLEVTLPVPPPISISLDSSTSVDCPNSNSGALYTTASGGQGQLSYEWSSGDTLSYIVNESAGYYQLTVTDSAGCTSDSIFQITAPFDLDPNESIIQNTICDSFAGQIQTSFSGGTPSYTFLWSTGSDSSAIDSLIPGMYSLTVTDAIGCDSSFNFFLDPVDSISYGIDSLSHQSCYEIDNGYAEVYGIGGTGPYNYLWPDGDTTSHHDSLAPGFYEVSITDSTACYGVIAGLTIQEKFVTQSLSITNDSCLDSLGSITRLFYDNTNSSTYAWSNSSTSSSISNLSPGYYTLTVTYNSGCPALVDSFEVTGPTNPLTVQLDSISNLSCYSSSNGTVSFTVSGGMPPYSYQWLGGSLSSTTITGLSAGGYTITVTDAMDCQRLLSFSVTQPSQILIDADVDDVTCYGLTDGEIALSLTGGYQPYDVLWSTGDTSSILSDLDSGAYQVEITDSIGCVETASFSIDAPSSTILIDSVSQMNILCAGSSTGSASVLSASGGYGSYTYQWTNGDTNSFINGIPAGVYSVTISDANGCDGDSAMFTVTEPDSLVIQAYQFDSLHCWYDSDGKATSIVNGGVGGYSYQWSTGSISDTIDGLDIGEVYVTVTDSNGCVTFDTAIIESLSDTIHLMLPSQNIDCYGDSSGSVQTAISGGVAPFQYQWSNGSSDSVLHNVGVGSYSVTVTDVFGCMVVDSSSLTQNDSINLQLTGSNVYCSNSTTGTASSTVSGGVQPYSYTWSNAATQANLNFLVPGTYELTLTDAVGCVDTASVEVTYDNFHEEVDLGPDTNLCDGDTLSWNLSQYDIVIWSTGSLDSVYSTSTAGLVWVDATDSNGCSSIDSIDVSIVPCLGISEAGLPIDWRIVPNPSTGLVRLVLSPLSTSKVTALEVKDETGRIVQEVAPSQLTKELDFSHLANGVYYFQLETIEGISVKQLVLNR